MDNPTGILKSKPRTFSFDTPLVRAILEAVEALNGATCDDVECLTGSVHQTCSARFYDLHKCGVIVDSGHKRPTRRGKQAIVWVRAADLRKAA